MSDNLKRYFAEAIGSSILLIVGCGTALFAYNSFGVLGIALAFGLSYLFCYYTISKISGCHLNPVFSLAAMLANRISVRDFWLYVLWQFIGAIFACIILVIFITFSGEAYNLLTDFHAGNGYGSLSLTGISVFGAILVEIILTCILTLTFMVCEFRKEKSNYSGVLISIVYVSLILVGFGFTGACMNPIRAFCPALLVLLFGSFTQIIQFFVFVIATLLGGILGVIVFKFFFKEDCGKLRLLKFLNK